MSLQTSTSDPEGISNLRLAWIRQYLACKKLDDTHENLKTTCQITPPGVKEETLHLNLTGLQSHAHPLLMFNYFINNCVALPLRIGVIIVDRRLPALMDK